MIRLDCICIGLWHRGQFDSGPGLYNPRLFVVFAGLCLPGTCPVCVRLHIIRLGDVVKRYGPFRICPVGFGFSSPRLILTIAWFRQIGLCRAIVGFCNY